VEIANRVPLLFREAEGRGNCEEAEEAQRLALRPSPAESKTDRRDAKKNTANNA
jgi:hypothetical protein